VGRRVPCTVSREVENLEWVGFQTAITHPAMELGVAWSVLLELSN